MMKFLQCTKVKFQTQDNRLTSIQTTLRNQQSSIQNIENQVGQLARILSERPQGSILCITKVNPIEHFKAIIMRSGQEVEMRAKKIQATKKVRSTEVEEKGSKKEVLENPIVKEY